MTPEEQKRYAKYLKIIDDFRLMDDDFMSIVFNDDTEVVGYVLRIILERDDLDVVSAKSQVEYHSATKRSIRLDVKAVDHTGKVYDIEIQRSDKGADDRRARYHGSVIDSGLLEKGQEFRELVDVYVIFIDEFDKFSAGKPMYHIDKCVRELDNAPYDDGAHIIYVNGTYRNTDDPVGRLMHDFSCKSADEALCPVIADRIRYYKEPEGGKRNMCRAIEELAKDIEHDKGVRTAVSLLSQSDLSLEKIADISELPLEEVKTLAAKQSV